MRRRTILLIAILGFIAFHAVRQKPMPVMANIYYDEQQLVDLGIPDTVVTHHSTYHEDIPATGLSLIMPDGYVHRANFAGFQRDKDTCIDVSEDHTSGIADKKQVVETYLAYLKKDHSKETQVLYRKDFKFNGYDAFIFCVSDTTRTRTAIYMAFGDDKFNVAMTGTMAGYNENDKADIINTMLTAYYTKHTA